MKFYKNRNNGEIIGIYNMRHQINNPTENSERLGYKGYSYSVVYDMVHPNCLLPNGLKSFSIEHTFLTSRYKRISKKLAFEKHPNFKQYTYQNLVDEAKAKGLDKMEVLRSQEY